MYSLTGFGIPARNPQLEAIQRAAAHDHTCRIYEVPSVGRIRLAHNAIPSTGGVFDRAQLVTYRGDFVSVAFLGRGLVTGGHRPDSSGVRPSGAG
ncbi:hypothetical protein [Nocardia terpenica]|uniref:hypothetical protein n=1 Tax=Nocardia terpenica TaxID=455432 RepID=UPI0012FD0D5A|nr:hypothetical protein [Nocardia terpenica]